MGQRRSDPFNGENPMDGDVGYLLLTGLLLVLTFCLFYYFFFRGR